MRVALMNHALQQVPNRFALCQLLAKSSRRMHKFGDSFQNTLTNVLGIIDTEKLGHYTHTAPAASPVEIEALLFDPA